MLVLKLLDIRKIYLRIEIEEFVLEIKLFN